MNKAVLTLSNRTIAVRTVQEADRFLDEIRDSIRLAAGDPQANHWVFQRIRNLLSDADVILDRRLELSNGKLEFTR